MRYVLLPLVLTFASASAFAHPEPTQNSVPASAVTPVQDSETGTRSQDFNLPSQSEIEEMIDSLPDFNAIIGDVIKLTENDRLQKRMERSGEAFSEKLEKSGALEPDENGIPDIKLALKVIASAVSDEDVTGGMLDTISELQTLMEKHVPEDEREKPAPYHD